MQLVLSNRLQSLLTPATSVNLCQPHHFMGDVNRIYKMCKPNLLIYFCGEYQLLLHLGEAMGQEVKQDTS